MLCKRLIACLDVRDGRVVKGTNFRGLQDAGDPAALAARYDAEGIDEVVVLDIAATLENRRARARTIESIASRLFIPLTVGGGIASLEDAAAMFDAGADKVSLNSAALRDPGLITRIADRYGSQAVIVAIDVQHTRDGARPYSLSGTRQAEGRAVDWAREACRRGAGEILVTSIDRDGTRTGFDLDVTAELARAVPVPVIASGGAGAHRHFLEAFTTGCADAALAASVFHFSEHAVPELKTYLAAAGVPVRC